MDVTQYLVVASLDDGMLGILGAMKQALQEAFFFLARTFWVSFLTLELYILKPLVLRTPVPTEFTFFTGHQDYIFYDPAISGPDGIIHQFYEKTSVLAGFAMTLGLIFSGFMLGMGITSETWLASAKDNLRRLLFTAPFIYLSIYMLQFVAELSAMTTSFFLSEEEYNDFLLELPQLIINPGTPKFSDEVGLIIGLAMTSIVLFAVVLELVARFAVMVFIPAISPLLFCLMIFNWSRPMAHSAIRLYITAAFFQPALAICLSFTMTLVLAMRSTSSGAVAPWAMLAGCAALMAYLPKVLSGAGSQLSQASSSIKTAAVATVATVALSTGAGAAAIGKVGSMGAAGVAGSKGGFGSVSSQISRGGNWMSKMGNRGAEAGLVQLGNVGREAFGMGGLSKLPHDDFGRQPAGRAALSFPDRQANTPTHAPTGSPSGLGAAKPSAPPSTGDKMPLGKMDRAAYNLGAAARRTFMTKQPEAPQAIPTLAGSASNLAELESGLEQAPSAPAELKAATQRAKANPTLAGHVNRLLAAPDGAAFQEARTAAAKDAALGGDDQRAFRSIAASAAEGRSLPAEAPRPGDAPVPASQGARFAQSLGKDAAKLLSEAERVEANEGAGGKGRSAATEKAQTLGRRAVYASAASTGSTRVAQELAQAEPSGAPQVDAKVKDAARELQTLEQTLSAVQVASHSTIKGASLPSMTSRQPNSVRDSLVALGRGSDVPATEPFLRQVEAGKYDADANKGLDAYLQKNPGQVKALGIPEARIDAVNPRQAEELLKVVPAHMQRERQVLKQISVGDQDNNSVRAYRTIQAEISTSAAPAEADVRVVTSFNRRMDDALVSGAPDTGRADIERALAGIRTEAAAGAQRLNENAARLAAEQALRVATHVEQRLDQATPK